MNPNNPGMTERGTVPTDLYIDVGKKTYGDLGFMRYGYFSLAASLFSKKIVENGKKVCPNIVWVRKASKVWESRAWPLLRDLRNLFITLIETYRGQRD